MPRYIEELNECTDPEPGDFLWVSDADATSTDRDRKLNLDKFELRKPRYYPIGAPTPLNLASTDADLKGFVGGFTDGRYGYFVPSNNGAYFGKVARVDLNNFAAGGITVLNLASTDADLKGFYGGFTDGRYGYFVPHYNGAFFGKVARVDLNNFAAGGITVLNLASTDADLKGFIGGFTDGRYGYFVPFNNGASFGKVARILMMSGGNL